MTLWMTASITHQNAQGAVLPGVTFRTGLAFRGVKGQRIVKEAIWTGRVPNRESPKRPVTNSKTAIRRIASGGQRALPSGLPAGNLVPCTPKLGNKYNMLNYIENFALHPSGGRGGNHFPRMLFGFPRF